jgi:ABC-type polysaccharide/polyol phosphate transport system ATPase subunit
LQDGGTSLLFVSHDTGIIPRVCKRALVLDQGSLIFDGPADAAVAEYGRLAAARLPDTARVTERA